MYYAVFLMRRIVYVFLLVLFTNNVTFSIATHGISSIFMILYVAIAKPFKKRVTAVLTILGEFFIVAMHAVGLALTDPDQPDEINQQFGFLIVLMLASYLIIGLVSTLWQIVGDVITECRARQQKEREENQ